MLQPYFEWLNNLPVSVAINESGWIAAVIQAFHLLALVLFTGGVLVVDLRLLGSGLTQEPVSRVARDSRPWLMWGLIGLTVTGIPQLMSLAQKEYEQRILLGEDVLPRGGARLYVHGPTQSHAGGGGARRPLLVGGGGARVDRAVDGGRRPRPLDRSLLT